MRPLFAELLRAVGAVDGIRRVRYTSPHPKDLRPETIAAMAETPAVCEHLHLPLQSGSDRVAGRHAPRLHRRALPRTLAAARAAVPDLAVTTDIIVGFPGETDDDFERTLEVVAAAEYDSAYTFIFSPRPGTEAAPHDRPLRRTRACAAERFERLRVVVERSRAGPAPRPASAAIEEVAGRGPEQAGPEPSLTGRTRQNKLVHFRRAVAAPAPARYAAVEVTGAAPHHLRGRARRGARRRAKRTALRIPVVAG